MGPSDLQELIDFRPFMPLRLTLSSGSVVELRRPDGLNITGMTMSVTDMTLRGQPRLRLISVPNIALVEPILDDRATSRLEDTQ